MNVPQLRHPVTVSTVKNMEMVMLSFQDNAHQLFRELEIADTLVCHIDGVTQKGAICFFFFFFNLL